MRHPAWISRVRARARDNRGVALIEAAIFTPVFFARRIMVRRTQDPGNSGRTPSRSTERGTAIIEFAILLPVIALVVFASIDLGHLASFHNRMANSAREGAGFAQIHPRSVASGCNGTNNIVDVVRAQNEDLADRPGFRVDVAKKTGLGGYEAYSGCDTANINPGDRVRVMVTAEVQTTGFVTSTAYGDKVRLTRTMEVVVQG